MNCSNCITKAETSRVSPTRTATSSALYAPAISGASAHARVPPCGRWRKGNGWKPAVAVFRDDKRGNFKAWLLRDKLGPDRSPTTIVVRLFVQLCDDDEPTLEFQQVWGAWGAAVCSHDPHSGPAYQHRWPFPACAPHEALDLWPTSLLDGGWGAVIAVGGDRFVEPRDQSFGLADTGFQVHDGLGLLGALALMEGQLALVVGEESR